MTDIVMRCDVTRNHVGTDTRMIGEPDCTCQGCQAAALIASQAARIRELEEGVEWYGEQARLARLIHGGGDPGRHALADDGGKRARSLLSRKGGE